MVGGESLYCNSSGCTLHDFETKSPWCAFAWSLEKSGSYSEEKIVSVFERFADRMELLIDRSDEPIVQEKSYVSQSEVRDNQIEKVRGVKFEP